LEEAGGIALGPVDFYYNVCGNRPGFLAERPIEPRRARRYAKVRWSGFLRAPSSPLWFKIFPARPNS